MSASHFGQKAPRAWAPEFQAVVLAGYGTSLQPLTNELSTGGGSSTPTPKALLPIGNVPMIFHPIQWLQSANIVDILVVCPASHKPLIHEAIWRSDESSPSFSHLSITLEGIEDKEAESLDTADILRKFTSRFVTDLIILPCDFVAPPKLKLSTFLNEYRVDMDRPLLKALLYERGDAVKDGPDAQLYGIDKKTNSLVFIDEQDEEEEELELNMSMLWKYPNTHLTRRFLDSHVYIVRHAVLELLAERPSLESFKDDFLPWVCKLPYRKSHRQKYLRSVKIPTDTQGDALLFSSAPYRDSSKSLRPTFNTVFDMRQGVPHMVTASSIEHSTNESDFFKSPQPSEARELSMSPPPGGRGELNTYGPSQQGNTREDKDDDPVKVKLLRCGVALHRTKDGYAGRANTIGGYFELNRQALSRAAAANTGPVPTHLAPSYGVGAQISADSQVAASTRVGDRTSVKKSVIGTHCVIGKNVKISGCVVMDYVVIKDGAKLDNSIVGRTTLIGERAQLKDCELAPGVTVQNDVSLKGERLSQW